MTREEALKVQQEYRGEGFIADLVCISGDNYGVRVMTSGFNHLIKVVQ